jgi:hypothetical protein
MALTNVERQNACRERHRGEPQGNAAMTAQLAALQGRVVQLEVENWRLQQTAGRLGLTGRLFRHGRACPGHPPPAAEVQMRGRQHRLPVSTELRFAVGHRPAPGRRQDGCGRRFWRCGGNAMHWPSNWRRSRRINLVLRLRRLGWRGSIRRNCRLAWCAQSGSQWIRPRSWKFGSPDRVQNRLKFLQINWKQK